MEATELYNIQDGDSGRHDRHFACAHRDERGHAPSRHLRWYACDCSQSRRYRYLPHPLQQVHKPGVPCFRRIQGDSRRRGITLISSGAQLRPFNKTKDN